MRAEWWRVFYRHISRYRSSQWACEAHTFLFTESLYIPNDHLSWYFFSPMVAVTLRHKVVFPSYPLYHCPIGWAFLLFPFCGAFHTGPVLTTVLISQFLNLTLFSTGACHCFELPFNSPWVGGIPLGLDLFLSTVSCTNWSHISPFISLENPLNVSKVRCRWCQSSHFCNVSSDTLFNSLILARMRNGPHPLQSYSIWHQAG